MSPLDVTEPKFGPVFEDLVKVGKVNKLTISELAASCLAFFLTFATETVPAENRVDLLLRIAKDLEVKPL